MSHIHQFRCDRVLRPIETIHHNSSISAIPSIRCLYATWGLKHRSLVWIRQVYRRRFGIEASYRQAHQAKIKTSSRNPVLRLVFVGVALVLRNV